MCGIAGFCNFGQNFLYDQEKWRQVLINMRSAIAHRGSDQTGEYLKDKVGFSHTRLSIRDVLGGAQPMVRSRGDAQYAIVYNGEVYNTDEFVVGLKKKGYRFDTTCDTEAILYAYMEYGEKSFSMLNGIFAFAIWDGQKRMLWLVRDQMGVKPLFYSCENGNLVFGSELKALFAHPDIEPAADDDSFREIFGIGPARTPGCGVFKNIHEIKPGCRALFTENGFFEEPYWSLQAAHHTDSYKETVDKVSFLVRDAVRRQMVSDVPVCSFLSGGIDSSIVTAVASDMLTEKGKTLDTFSFDFVRNDRYFKSNSFQPTRDKPFVDLMRAAYPVRHTILECDETTLPDLILKMVEAKDLPGMTDIDASLLYFCSIVKRYNKVALTGECADEIFGGYPWFYRQDLLSADGFPWSSDMHPRTMLLRDEAVQRLNLEDYAHHKYEESCRQTPTLDGESKEEARRRQISWLNMRWFMQTLLDRMDRTSMFCALEARVPFADRRIVEYLYNVPWEMKYQNGVEKALLRDACADLLPPEILHRKKSPYPKTYAPQYEQMLAAQLSKLLKDSNAPIHRFVDTKKTENFLVSPKDYGRPWFGQLMAGPQMMAYLLQVNRWMEQFNIG